MKARVISKQASNVLQRSETILFSSVIYIIKQTCLIRKVLYKIQNKWKKYIRVKKINKTRWGGIIGFLEYNRELNLAVNSSNKFILHYVFEFLIMSFIFCHDHKWKTPQGRNTHHQIRHSNPEFISRKFHCGWSVKIQEFNS